MARGSQGHLHSGWDVVAILDDDIHVPIVPISTIAECCGDVILAVGRNCTVFAFGDIVNFIFHKAVFGPVLAGVFIRQNSLIVPPIVDTARQFKCEVFVNIFFQIRATHKRNVFNCPIVICKPR